MRPPRSAALALSAAIAACATSDREDPGEILFGVPDAQPRGPGGPGNAIACSFCHFVEGTPYQPDPEVIYPGGSLRNAASRRDAAGRPLWWDGRVGELVTAVSWCRRAYMGAAIADDDPMSGTLERYLAQSSPDATAPAVEFGPQEGECDVQVRPGDAASGEALWNRACARCHGEVGGRSLGWVGVDFVPGIRHTDFCLTPEDPGCNYRQRWQHATRNVRAPLESDALGAATERMPFFLRSVLDDQALADVLEYLCEGDPACREERDRFRSQDDPSGEFPTYCEEFGGAAGQGEAESESESESESEAESEAEAT